jgi:hypothetical protein
MMPRRAALLPAAVALLVLALPGTSVRADDAPLVVPRVRFASLGEARALLGSRDAWAEATSPFQRAALVADGAPISIDRLLAFMTETALPWPPEGEARWRRAWSSIAPRLAELRVPLPADLLLVDSDGRDQGGAPYTRGAAVILPNALVPPDATPGGDAGLLAHELFHLVSRQHPELATRLYRTIGFQPVPPLQWPAAWLPLRIVNPDAPFDGHAMTLEIDGRPARLMPVLVARRPELAAGETFFSVMDVRLLEVEVAGDKTLPLLRAGAPVWHALREVPAYLARLGGNTGYIIHPEETMADNFSLLVTRQPVPNGVLLERIEAVLRGR